MLFGVWWDRPLGGFVRRETRLIHETVPDVSSDDDRDSPERWRIAACGRGIVSTRLLLRRRQLGLGD